LAGEIGIVAVKLAGLVKWLEGIAILLALVWLVRAPDWEPAITLVALVAAFIGTHVATRPAGSPSDAGHADHRRDVTAPPTTKERFVITSYVEGGRRVDVVEGTVAVDTLNWGATVLLPPFIDPPEITFGSGPSPDRKPEIASKTADAFSIRIDSSGQSGRWTWRARGQLLRKPEDPA
jgi:hypothetical protein